MRSILECRWRRTKNGINNHTLDAIKDSEQVALIVLHPEDYALLKAYLMVVGAKAQVFRNYGEVPTHMVPMSPIH